MSAIPLVYDAGALLAAERNDRKFLVMHKTALLAGRHVLVPAPVLTQAWRGGGGQAVLARVLKGCEILPTDEDVAKRAGVLLGLSRTADAVDAIVVATAVKLTATVVTSDPKDLQVLGDAARFHLGLVEV
ncbi:PIN domain-containing protein [Actinophytocola sp.]|uniref:PIN domain-containing protein n=1 Tax=Actinophytocola sp. TaxID=1872138 RepID=UPI002ED57FF0